jgi:hypothetical protein
MRRTLKSGALKKRGALELIVRSALEATRPARFLQIVARLNAVAATYQACQFYLSFSLR